MHGSTLDTGTINLIAGQRYDIVMEFFEQGGAADARLAWQPPGESVLTIIPAANLSPVASSESSFASLLVSEETPTPIFLPGFDVEFYRSEPGATVSYTVDQPPAHGSLNFANGDWTSPARNPVTYTPAANYNGPDNFSYHLTDNLGATSLGASPVYINVTELNDPPSISPIADLVILEDTSTGPISFIVTDSDHPATTVLVTPRSSDTRLVRDGSIILTGSDSNRTVTVTPVPGEIGTVTIELTATDPLFGQSTRSFKSRRSEARLRFGGPGRPGLAQSAFGTAAATRVGLSATPRVSRATVMPPFSAAWGRPSGWKISARWAAPAPAALPMLLTTPIASSAAPRPRRAERWKLLFGETA